MISELTFARNYSSFWNSLFPGGEDYVRLINSSLGERFSKPFEIEDFPFRRALINNISFGLFEKTVSKTITIKEIEGFKTNSELLTSLSLSQKTLLSTARFGEKMSFLINKEELQTIKVLTKRLVTKYSSKLKTICRPNFQGCGIIFEAQGDLIFGNSLVEVKAGLRNFSILDIRQLYVYLSLNHQSKEYDLYYIELCNPRTGIVWKEVIDVVSDNLAGASSVEVYHEIINFISNNNPSL